jgi:hypothetical protein
MRRRLSTSQRRQEEICTWKWDVTAAGRYNSQPCRYSMSTWTSQMSTLLMPSARSRSISRYCPICSGMALFSVAMSCVCDFACVHALLESQCLYVLNRVYERTKKVSSHAHLFSSQTHACIHGHTRWKVSMRSMWWIMSRVKVAPKSNKRHQKLRFQPLWFPQ